MKPSSLKSLLNLLPLAMWTMAAPLSSAADSPLVIPFQGQVTNQQNQLVATGQYSIIFNLYDVAVGGQPLWTERHSKVGVTNGMVNVFLGSITSLAQVDFSQTRYLGITIDVDDKPTTADPEMVPRQMIIPAFHAKKAENATKLAGHDWSSFVVTSGGASSNDPSTGFLNASKIQPSSITANQIQDAAVTSAKIQNGALVAADLSPALQADTLIPAGSVVAYAGTSAPTGWAMCDGTLYSKTDPSFARLFGAIGLAHGGDANNFRVPDYRGRFLRGVDGGVGRDVDRAGRSPMNPGGPSGDVVGTVENDAFEQHTHSVNDPGHFHYGFFRMSTAPGGGAVLPYGISLRNSAGEQQLDGGGVRTDITQTGLTVTGVNTANVWSSETRPVNAAVNYIIKL